MEAIDSDTDGIDTEGIDNVRYCINMDTDITEEQWAGDDAYADEVVESRANGYNHNPIPDTLQSLDFIPNGDK